MPADVPTDGTRRPKPGDQAPPTSSARREAVELAAIRSLYLQLFHSALVRGLEAEADESAVAAAHGRPPSL